MRSRPTKRGFCRLAPAVRTRGYNSLNAAIIRLISRPTAPMLTPTIHLMRSTLAVSMSALVSCRKASSALVSCRQGFDVSLGGFNVGLGGEILFEQPDLLTHDGFGLALGHAGTHQLVDGCMCIKDQWCHGLAQQDFLIPSPSALRAPLWVASGLGAIIPSMSCHNLSSAVHNKQSIKRAGAPSTSSLRLHYITLRAGPCLPDSSSSGE